MTQYLNKNGKQTDNYQVIDLHSDFADTNDLMISSYRSDRVHYTDAGYVQWQNLMKEFVND